jgi:hypothetical protein
MNLGWLNVTQSRDFAINQKFLTIFSWYLWLESVFTHISARRRVDITSVDSTVYHRKQLV